MKAFLSALATASFIAATLAAAAAAVASGCTPKTTKSEEKAFGANKSKETVETAVRLPYTDVSECATLSEDPANTREFVFNARLRSGKKVEEAIDANLPPPCIKNDMHRPITFLTPAQVKVHVPQWLPALERNFAVIANVSHIDPESFDWSNPAKASTRAFWFAKIPLDKVKDTYFQLEHFPSFSADIVDKITALLPDFIGMRAAGKQIFKVGNDYIAGHTQLRVEFSEDVELVSQFTGTKDTTRNLVFTVEAVGEQGYTFDLVSGLGANFVAMHRVTTMEQKFYDMMIAEEAGGRKYHVVEQVKLSIGNVPEKLPAAHEALVRLFLAASERNGMQIKFGAKDEYAKATYNTITNNCTNAITRLIDDAAFATGAYRGGRGVIANLMDPVDFFPAIVHNGLENRGLVVDPNVEANGDVYSHDTMCEEESMKSMQTILFKYIQDDSNAGKKLPEGVKPGACPELSTERPRMTDLFWRAR